jgi:H+/gluconate symporter-like permease
MACLILALRIFSENGFRMYPFAPACMAETAFPASELTVTMMKGIAATSLPDRIF